MEFGVVADEVSNLAHRCAQAAAETAALIEESISKSGIGTAQVDLVAAAVRLITPVDHRGFRQSESPGGPGRIMRCSHPLNNGSAARTESATGPIAAG